MRIVLSLACFAAGYGGIVAILAYFMDKFQRTGIPQAWSALFSATAVATVMSGVGVAILGGKRWWFLGLFFGPMVGVVACDLIQHWMH
jgi:predicted PurR-regulated permease PerM